MWSVLYPKWKPLKAFEYRNSAEHCKEFCEDTAGCVGWSFDTSNNNCTANEETHRMFYKESFKTLRYRQRFLKRTQSQPLRNLLPSAII